MRPAPRADASIRVDLTLPVTRVGLGPLSFDPLEQLVGAPIAEILGPLVVGRVHQRRSSAGTVVDVYPLALPEGEGASISLGAWGELGLHNDGGVLVLTVPLAWKGWIAARLTTSRTSDGVGDDGRVPVVRFWLVLRPGQRVTVPLGPLGEMGLQVA